MPHHNIISDKQWVQKAWGESVTEDVWKLFKACGILVKPDGIEDSEICCLKSSGVAEDATSLVTQCTAVLHPEEDLEDDTDSFANVEEDKSELETNEAVIDNED